MKRLSRPAALWAAAVVIGFACKAENQLLEVSTVEDTLQFLVTNDSTVTTVDTMLIGADTVIVQRVDTVFQDPDTVFVQHTDTVVVGGDTTYVQLVDTLVHVDTLVFNYVDTVVVHDTVYVADTIVVSGPTVSLSVSSLTLNVGQSKTVSASVKNYLGQVITTDTIHWSSDDPSIASVTPLGGTITGVAAGNVTIRAFTGQGTTANLAVQVNDTVTVVSGGQFRRNRPPGLAVISDYGFDDSPPPHIDGSSTGGYLGNSGWETLDWGKTGGGIFRTADPTGPVSPGYVLEEVYPPHLSGSGPSVWFRSFPSVGTLYISWIMKWDAGFDHNPTSEKEIYFNPTASNYFIFQFHYRQESIYNIKQADGAGSLTANKAGGNATFQDGVWIEYELFFDQATGTVRWWKNGVLQGEHTGRTFPRIDRVKFATTWGGGGDKVGTQSRYTDHVFVAGGN